ncbi:hypothetical protein ACLOJK_031931 [Asimina triloba]
MDKRKVAVPLVCHGHSRPVVDLFYSPVTPDGFFLISASKGTTEIWEIKIILPSDFELFRMDLRSIRYHFGFSKVKGVCNSLRLETWNVCSVFVHGLKPSRTQIVDAHPLPAMSTRSNGQRSHETMVRIPFYNEESERCVEKVIKPIVDYGSILNTSIWKIINRLELGAYHGHWFKKKDSIPYSFSKTCEQNESLCFFQRRIVLKTSLTLDMSEEEAYGLLHCIASAAISTLETFRNFDTALVAACMLAFSIT